MSVSSHGHSEGGGRPPRPTVQRGTSKTQGVDDSLLPPFVHQLDTKMKDYEREGDIEFPFEDTTGAGDENRLRGNWSSRTDALLAIAGFTFGLGNLWRFPFLVYSYGGSAFFVPFCICLCMGALPVFLLEITLGQFSSLAAISVWKAVPLFKGIGIAAVFLSSVLSLYLSVVSSWSIYYLVNSIGLKLPWSQCENSWSSYNCTSTVRSQCQELNGTMLLNGSCVIVDTQRIVDKQTGGLRSLEYFHKSVLMMSGSIGEVEHLNWYLGICVLFAWILVFLCLFQSVKSSGKVVYVLVVLPYIILIALIVRLVSLDGSLEALIHFMKPDWSVLKNPRVWGEAAIQAFYSLSCCTGGLVTLASYNRFHSNLFREVWLIPLMDVICSLAACALTFSAVGCINRQLGGNVADFQLKDGAHLLFVFLSEALSAVPAAPLYAALFFLMLVLIILSTQIFVVETVVSSLCDHYAEHLRKNRRHVLALVCLSLMFLSLPFCTSAGMYWLALLDRFALRWPLIVLAFLEVMAIAWVYDVDNLLDDIKWMTGVYPPVYLFWKVLWKYVCPLVYISILSFVWMHWETLKYEEYAFPYWANLLGWGISAIPLLIIIVSGIEEVANGRGTFCERWRAVLNPDDSWGPALAIHRAEHFPLQIPEARRLLIACDDDFPVSSEAAEAGWKESRDDSLAPPKGGGTGTHVSMDRVSRAATIASVPTFERETAI